MYHMLIVLATCFVLLATATDVPTTTPSICGLMIEDEVSKLANIKPQSGNKVVAAAFVKTIDDDPGVSLRASGTIEVGSGNLVSFDFISFYFACVLSLGTAAAVQAVPCTVQVSSPGVKDVT
ncbi:hypothetical protein LTR10_012978 [Elasticomyces elasticus]|nr:hypothetical protein LTR10_012978 [Elasticomyces elasticus]KAK4978599.1 hypothetical protein LTR42_001099 [Elasticomyces elasticus]